MSPHAVVARWAGVWVGGMLFVAQAWAAEAPPPRTLSVVQAVLAQAPAAPAVDKLRPLHVVLVADKKDHGPGAHDYPQWQKCWKLLLGGADPQGTAAGQVNLFGPAEQGNSPADLAGTPRVSVSTAWQWPSAEQFRTANLIVMFCYRSGGAPRAWGEMHVKQLDEFLARGGGFVPIHSATYSLGDLQSPCGKRAVETTGLVFDKAIQVRHGPMTLEVTAAAHPICRGLPRSIEIFDEPYWPPTGNLRSVETLVVSSEAVAKDAVQKAPQPMFWTCARGKGRVFGCVPGHFNWTFDDPLFRILLLRGMAWAAGESPYRFDGLTLRGARVSK